MAADDQPKREIGDGCIGTHQLLLIWRKGGEKMGGAALFKNPFTPIPQSDFLIKSGPDWP